MKLGALSTNIVTEEPIDMVLWNSYPEAVRVFWCWYTLHMPTMCLHALYVRHWGAVGLLPRGVEQLFECVRRHGAVEFLP